MTQYDEIKTFIEACPGATRFMIRKKLPHITHENELLKRLIESGDGRRERVVNPVSGRECWGYWLC